MGRAIGGGSAVRFRWRRSFWVTSAWVMAASSRRVFGTTIASDAPETVLVDIAKALAAFQDTLRTGRTLFDDILMLQPERP
jgi:hypothetical protein